MPMLYEQAKAHEPQIQHLLILKLKQPLTPQQKHKLLSCKSLMEQEANVNIHKIQFQPKQILVHYSPQKGFVIPIIWAIAAIAIAIGIPVTAWFITQVPTGPLGLPQWFWIGVGVGIPLFGLALVLWMARK